MMPTRMMTMMVHPDADELINGTNIVSANLTINALYGKQISAGVYHAVAIKSDSALWAWGDNGFVQLGIIRKSY